MAEEAIPILDVQYNDMFTPNLLVYFDPIRASVWDIDVNKMNFSNFTTFREKLTNYFCKDLYYCVADISLAEGLHVI